MKRIVIIRSFGSFMLLASMLSVSCEKVDDDIFPADQLIERKDFSLTKSQKELVTINNSFAFNLFSQVAKDNETSLVISPLSMIIDLGMVANGAVGTTQQEILETLGYNSGDVDGLNEFCRTMLGQSAAVDPSTKLEISNVAVINSKQSELKESYTKTVESFYDAGVIYKDFSSEDIRKAVNDWCKESTHGMIPELLSNPVTGNEYAHFLNAIYFKGIWSNKFSKGDTKKETFTGLNGFTRAVDMMHQKGDFSWGGFPGLFTAVSMPYGNQAYRMTLLLPDVSKTLHEVIDAVNAEVWKNLYMCKMEVDIKMPSFETEYELHPKEILSMMGIRQAFSLSADFSAMTASDVLISDIAHKAKIKVDEEGSEVAAATDIIMATGASVFRPEMEPISFYADRPFLYVITEVSSGAIFFIGQYTGL